MKQTIFDTLCSILDDMNLSYTEHKEDGALTLGYKGEDMNHDLLILIRDEKKTVSFFERLPFDIDPEHLSDATLAAAYINSIIILGKFSINAENKLDYEVTVPYDMVPPSAELLTRCLLALVTTVENYDDKFMALNKGYLKPEAFLEN